MFRNVDGSQFEFEWYEINGAVVKVRLKKGEVIHETEAEGEGPVDSIFRAIIKVVTFSYELKGLELEDINFGAVSENNESPKAAVTAVVSCNGLKATGEGVAVDMLAASAKACVDAINKVLHQSANSGRSND